MSYYYKENLKLAFLESFSSKEIKIMKVVLLVFLLSCSICCIVGTLSFFFGVSIPWYVASAVLGADTASAIITIVTLATGKTLATWQAWILAGCAVVSV